MLHLSHVLIAQPDLGSFEALAEAVSEYARNGERFFRMDVRPPFPDTPENWEDRLEAAFYARNR
jgi:hypothetical protein